MGRSGNEISRRWKGFVVRTTSRRWKAEPVPAGDQYDGIDELAQEIQLILKAKPPTDLREGWSLLKQGIHLLHARPKHAKEGACQEVMHLFEHTNQFSLLDLPIQKCWPKDGGRFIT